MATAEVLLDSAPTSMPQNNDAHENGLAPDLQLLAKAFGLDMSTTNALMIPDMNFLQVRGLEHAPESRVAAES